MIGTSLRQPATLGMLLLLVVAACATLAPKEEYAAYRAIKLAQDDETRLVAMQRYAAGYPDGRWAPEVAAARKAEDVHAFESGKDSRAGLSLYLTAFPDGAFAPQAQQRLAAIDLIEAQRAAEVERAALAAKVERERELEARRTWVRRFVQYWVTSLAGLSNWGAPIAEVAAENAEFSAAFARPPRPRCTATECVKYYTATYAIPVPGATRLERSVQLLLRLQLGEGGTLERAELLMPGWGFSRWFEVEQKRLVVDTAPAARDDAVTWALTQLRPMVASLGDEIAMEPDYQLASIEKPAVGPTGESTDTTADSPAAPGTQVHAQNAAGAEADASAQVDFLDAASFRQVVQELEAESADAGVPTTSEDSQGQAVIAELPQAQTEAAEPRVEAAVVGGVRVVLFAASSAASGPVYDGILIEPSAPKKNKIRKRASK